MNKINPILDRYPFKRFESAALRNNPLKISPVRSYRIYLPPNYYLTPEVRYPVIYFLHGYGGDIDNLILISKTEIKQSFPLLFRLFLPKVFKLYPTFEILDHLIQSHQLTPFILVQPDSSISIRCKFNLTTNKGGPLYKGSLYVNSPYTGQWADYIFQDLLEHIDSHFRTIPDKAHRAIMGASMGGYGALYAGIFHPDQFSSAVAISPLVNPLELVDHRMIVPFNKMLFGKKKAACMGDAELVDTLDTIDSIFSSNARLIVENDDPTIRQIHRELAVSIKNWNSANLFLHIKNNPQAFRDINLLFNCERTDEYNISPQVEELHKILRELGISHQYEIYQNAYAAKISPHQIGILSKIIGGLEFCTAHFPS